MDQYRDEADALVQLIIQNQDAARGELDIRAEVTESSRAAFLTRLRNSMPVLGTGDACGPG